MASPTLRLLDLPLQIATVSDGTQMRRTDMCRVFFQRSSKRDLTSARLPRRPPARELRLIHEAVEPASDGINPHAVAVA